MKWDNGYLVKREWTTHVQKSIEKQQLLPWGLVCGMHNSEADAIAAMRRKEIKKVVNPKWNAQTDDMPKYLYKMASLVGANCANLILHGICVLKTCSLMVLGLGTIKFEMYVKIYADWWSQTSKWMEFETNMFLERYIRRIYSINTGRLCIDAVYTA